MTQLTWLLVKKNNAFLVKRDGYQFSKDPCNLTNKNTYSASGLANERAIGIDLNEKGNIVMSTKSTGKSRKLKSSLQKTRLSKFNKKMTKCVTAQTSAYRSDLRKAALARWSALDRSLKVDISEPVAPKQKRGRRA